LYLAVGWQSLLLHAKQVAIPLAEGDLEQARYYVSWIVSRDTEQLDEKEVAKAATESVLENGADAIFAALFWFCLLGIPGVVLYRCANTLDAMWGYKNERFLSFGWAAARLDDVLNYVPARLTALSYSLLATSGHRFQAFKCWREQGYIGKSPNAGPVMATGAGALNVSLGGAASYHNRIEQKPVLGPEETASTLATSQAIYAACGLINRTLAAWVLVILVISLLERMKILG
jgi:adenosylcobinamide-phosphate synthase